MNHHKISDFLDSVCHASELPTYTVGDIERHLMELACEGCGDGATCKKDILCRPCGNSCDACLSGNRRECSYCEPCNDCFYCGCPKCYSDLYKSNDYDTRDEYRERVEHLEKQLVDAIKDSPIALESWMSVFSPQFIKSHYPWKLNRQL